MNNKFGKFVESECERQWNDCQAEDGFEQWYEQSDDVKAEYYNSMYEHLEDRYEEIIEQ